jgi:hypothetical protein
VVKGISLSPLTTWSLIIAIEKSKNVPNDNCRSERYSTAVKCRFDPTTNWVVLRSVVPMINHFSLVSYALLGGGDVFA